MTTKVANYINHVGLVIDASGSMSGLRDQVVKVADNLVAYLAQRSKELDQETRITVYDFASRGDVRCLIFDKDVLRLPSLKGLYSVRGMTALVDATAKAIDEMRQTSTLYGEHGFLLYVLTDGQENASGMSGSDLAQMIGKLPDIWTVACFVPDVRGLADAKRFGFPAGNISQWDTTGKLAVEEVGEVIRRTTDTYMTNRSKGIRSYTNLFQMDVEDLSKASMKKLDRLGPGQFRMLKVDRDTPISDFVEAQTRRAYRLGEAYYELMKRETIQPAKILAIYSKKEHAVYTGDNARKLLGLPNHEIKVAPADHKDFTIFVQSTSTNRKLIGGTTLLLLS